MSHFNGMLYDLKKMQGVKGTIISKRCITPFKGII